MTEALDLELLACHAGRVLDLLIERGVA